MSKKEKFTYLLKNYGYLGILLLSTILFVVIIAISASSNTGKAPQVENVNSSNIQTMMLPVAGATISKEYSNTSLQYNATLKQYEAHMALDFVGAEGSRVYSVLDGTVSEVGNNYLQGNYVVITHDNGLKSVYSSLDDSVSVSAGDSVKKGDVIGVIGKSAYSELEEGAHLHFELIDNDKKIDPAGYLDIENK